MYACVADCCEPASEGGVSSSSRLSQQIMCHNLLHHSPSRIIMARTRAETECLYYTIIILSYRLCARPHIGVFCAVHNKNMCKYFIYWHPPQIRSHIRALLPRRFIGRRDVFCARALLQPPSLLSHNSSQFAVAARKRGCGYGNILSHHIS